MKRASSPVFLCFLLSLLCWGAPSQEDIQALWQKAQKGDAQAQVDLGLVYVQGEGEGYDQLFPRVGKWWGLSMEELATAQYNHDVFYGFVHGKDIAGYMKEAVKVWRFIAEREGLAWAQCNLGGCYYKGNGITKDVKEAVKWWRLAAKQGLPQAQYNPGVIYANGEGVSQDKEMARKWFHAAWENGDEAVKALAQEALNELNKN